MGCMRQVLRPGALGRPRGIGWRGRWEGGSGWGMHVNPWLIHVNVWQNPLKCCEVISLQLIKINEKKIGISASTKAVQSLKYLLSRSFASEQRTNRAGAIRRIVKKLFIYSRWERIGTWTRTVEVEVHTRTQGIFGIESVKIGDG